MNVKPRQYQSAAVLLAICCLSVASAQWFEGWISLPDSLVGVTPGCLACDSATSTVWIGGGGVGRLLAINTDSNKVVASIRLPGTRVSHLCGASNSHTVFGSMADRDTVVVVSCSSHAVQALIPVANPGLLYYSPTFNKVYCACDTGVAIIDAATNHVIRTLHIAASDFCEDTEDGWICCAGYATQLVTAIGGTSDDVAGWFRTEYRWPIAVCYSTKSNRVFCAHNYDHVVVVAHRDTVLRTISVREFPVDLCYNSVANKVYCADWSGSAVSVIDCSTYQVKSIDVLGPEFLVYDSLLNRAYCGTGSKLVVIDGDDDVVLGTYAFPVGDGLLFDRENQKLYYPLSTRDSVGVQSVDCATCESVAFTPTVGSEHPKTVRWNSVRNKVYVACQGEQDRLAVIDGSTGSVIGWIHTGFYPCALTYDPARDRIYSADSGSASVTVGDCAIDSAIASVRVGEVPVALLDLPDVGKVYCANRVSGTISVIDASTNLVTKTIQTGGTAPCALAYSSQSDKLYCLNGGSHNISVIAESSDSLLHLVSGGTSPMALAYSSGRDRLYCVDEGRAVIAIDCRSDSVLATVSLEGARGIGYDRCSDVMYCSRCYYVGRLDYRLGIAILDCGSNGKIADFELPHGSTQVNSGRLEFGYNSYDHKMYCRSYQFAGGGYVYVCSFDNLLGSFLVGGFGGGFAWNERQDRMYLACDDDSRIAVVRDYGGGIEEDPSSRHVSGLRQMATIARSVLSLAEVLGHESKAASLIDVSGRRVLALHTGANDVRALAPGVYFVRVEGAGSRGQSASSVTKVVVTR
jgi:YVTN family beta-propeller protein